jgi:general secretion pathway protein C
MSILVAPSSWQKLLALRALNFLVWFALAVELVFWSVRLLSDGPARELPPAVGWALPSADSAALMRLLGQQDAPRLVLAAPAAKNVKVLGVVAQGSGAAATGAALIAIEDQPARPYRLGETVLDGYVLRTLDTQRAVLAAADGAADWVLDMPREYEAGSVSALAKRPGARPPPGNQARARASAQGSDGRRTAAVRPERPGGRP